MLVLILGILFILYLNALFMHKYLLYTRAKLQQHKKSLFQSSDASGLSYNIFYSSATDFFHALGIVSIGSGVIFFACQFFLTFTAQYDILIKLLLFWVILILEDVWCHYGMVTDAKISPYLQKFFQMFNYSGYLIYLTLAVVMLVVYLAGMLQMFNLPLESEMGGLFVMGYFLKIWCIASLSSWLAAICLTKVLRSRQMFGLGYLSYLPPVIMAILLLFAINLSVKYQWFNWTPNLFAIFAGLASIFFTATSLAMVYNKYYGATEQNLTNWDLVKICTITLQHTLEFTSLATIILIYFNQYGLQAVFSFNNMMVTFLQPPHRNYIVAVISGAALLFVLLEICNNYLNRRHNSNSPGNYES